MYASATQGGHNEAYYRNVMLFLLAIAYVISQASSSFSRKCLSGAYNGLRQSAFLPVTSPDVDRFKKILSKQTKQ